MKRGFFPVAALAIAGCLGLAGCSTTGGSNNSATTSLELPHPNDVSNGHRVVYVLQDVSCDMTGPRDIENRKRALEVGVNTAAFDAGTLERGVVRALSSQNVIFQTVDFKREGSDGTLRVDNALTEYDDAVRQLAPLAGSAKGQGCLSDLLGALSQIPEEERAVEQRIGSAPAAKDIIFVTNGLIVDKARKIVLTRQPIEIARVYRQVLTAIRKSWTPPDLRGFTIWFVGLGYAADITTNRGPAVQRLWRQILEPTHVVMKPIDQTAADLPTSLGSR